MSEKIINTPNAFTFVRFVLTPINILLHIFLGPVWKLLCSLFVAISLATDILDGFFARRLNQTTRFGQIFDHVTDFIMVNSYNIYIIFALDGIFSARVTLVLRSLVLVLILRYLFVAVTVTRIDKISPGAAKAILAGKYSSVLQMFIIFLFMSITAIDKIWWRNLFSHLYAAFLFAGVFMAIVSAVMYYLRYHSVKISARASS